MQLNKKKGVTLWLTAFLIATFIVGCHGNTNVKQNHLTDPGKTSSASADNKESELLLQEIKTAAQEGKVPGCEYTLKSTCIEDIEKDWGKPAQTDYIPEAKGTFAAYPDRGLVFGFNKGAQIFDIRSYDKKLTAISQTDLKTIYGKPDNIRNYNGEDILGYIINDEFKIRFVFPEKIDNNPDPQLDHISIFYPRGTVNLMADDPGLEW